MHVPRLHHASCVRGFVACVLIHMHVPSLHHVSRVQGLATPGHQGLTPSVASSRAFTAVARLDWAEDILHMRQPRPAQDPRGRPGGAGHPSQPQGGRRRFRAAPSQRARRVSALAAASCAPFAASTSATASASSSGLDWGQLATARGALHLRRPPYFKGSPAAGVWVTGGCALQGFGVLAERLSRGSAALGCSAHACMFVFRGCSVDVTPVQLVQAL